MKKLTLAIGVLLAGASAGAAVFFIIAQPLRESNDKGEEVRQNLFPVLIADALIHVEVAASLVQQVRGLSGRAGLAADQGMLFVYDEPGLRSFWMKDMNFPIDIIWIGKDRRVIDVDAGVRPDSYPQTFQSPAPAQFVLEVNAGMAEHQGIVPGAFVDLSGIPLLR